MLAPPLARVTGGGGAIKGRIEFEGEKPELKPLAITAEQAKGCCPEGVEVDATDESLLTDEKNGLANVVVTIKVEGMKTPEATEPVTIDQKQCHFVPHVQVAPAGSTLVYLNSDTVSHNIHTYSVKNSGMNQAVSGGGKLEQKLEKAEPVKISCDYHPWMAAHVVVTDASAWAVTKPDGSFEISGIPAGKYTLELWHERLGKGKQEITVNEDGSADAGTIKMGEAKKDGGRRKR
jgi:plastocyanin